MKLSSIVRLYRVRLRARFVQELFAVLGIAIGVALLFASQVASTSLDRSAQQLTRGVLGDMRFQIAARDAHGFDERLLAQVHAIPGVSMAVPVLEANANVVGPDGTRSVDLVGTDPRLAGQGGQLVRSLRALRFAKLKALIVPAPIAQAIGDSSLQRIDLQIGESTVSALLVPQLLKGAAGGLAGSSIALAPLAYAQALTGLQGRLTSIFVSSPPALDRQVLAGLRSAGAGSLNIRPATFNEALFDRAARPTNQSTGLFSAISALVGFLFAFNALLLTVPQRRDLIEDLRLDGYTRGMIVEVLMFDALVLGVVACAAGLALGELLSSVLFDSNPGYLSFAFPIGPRRIVTWTSVALAVAGGLLAAFIGVLAPLRGAILSRRDTFFSDPAYRSARRTTWLLVGGVSCLLATTVILLAAPAAAIAGVVILAAALLLLLPLVLDGLTLAFDRLQVRFAGASSYLAVIELRSPGNRARSIGVAATGAIAVFGSVAIQTAHGDLQEGLNRVARGLNATTDVWVSPASEANSLATTPFHGVVAAQVAALPAVRSIGLYRGSFLDIGDRRTWVIAPPRQVARPLPRGQLLEGSTALATRRFHEGGWIIISRAIAQERNLHVGDLFTLPAPRPTPFRIAALSTNFGWPSGAIMLNADDYARAWGSSDPSALLVGLQPGISPAAGRSEIRRALGSGSGLEVQTAAERERDFRATGRQGLSRLTQISALVLIATVLAMSATMGAMIWQRRPRLAEMKVDGFSRDVLWRALLWESGLLLGAGCSLGAVFGLYGQVILSHALVTVTGFPVAFSPGILIALASFVLVTATAMLIVAVPGALATRVRPALSIRD
ncbi:MAG TPA: FtsX-like permease family protein [Solirubrobacteraceae bacterium]|jgi:putative ABC transport system permease protein|nr:FtsX-like permease family protein [Solirubrobacteraceae bacterium]